MKQASFGVILACAGAMCITAGCSSSPSQEELKQLDALHAESASLHEKAKSLQAEKSALEKAVADKGMQLQQCTSDRQALQSR